MIIIDDIIVMIIIAGRKRVLGHKRVLIRGKFLNEMGVLMSVTKLRYGNFAHVGIG
jgi:hypothetical protein